jgi:hypothetical protein
MMVGASEREDLLDISSPYETRISRQYTATILDMLTGEDPKRHLWCLRNGHFALLEESDQALSEPYAWKRI